ncbi:MAG: SseB family protein, partial [Stackebrandtia sp.]
YGETAYPPQQTSGLPRRGAAAQEPAPAPEPVAADGEWLTEEQVEEGLADSASGGDTANYLAVLMRSWTFLPVPDGVPPHARPGDADFSWHTDFVDGAHCVTAFTSVVRLQARYGDQPHVRTAFARVVKEWPGLEYSLYVNPGTEIGANMPGPQLTTLLTWARSQGLMDAGLEMEKRAEEQAVQSGGGGPELMQKIVPHRQVPLILERGYDRVAGFVHRYDDVAELTTPDSLYRGLGLLREGSGFSSADESVHVLRWTGYRSGLYQIAYGGNDLESARLNGGWIVEPPPFVGDGYTAGVDGRRIPEYKIDSLRLPHGAVMHRIDADGYSAEVAVYDADRREWTKIPVGGGGRHNPGHHGGGPGGPDQTKQWEWQHA